MRTKKIKTGTTEIKTETELLPSSITDNTAVMVASTVHEPILQINITDSVENVVIDNTVVVEKKKRGRKKLIKPEPAIQPSSCDQNDGVDGNSTESLDTVDKKEKEKKQRKVRVSKQEKQEIAANDGFAHDDNDQESSSTPTSSATVVHKKRGRKPRGGKIIHENQIQKNNSPDVPNIILHLKCVLSDLKKSNDLSSNKLENYCNEKKTEILCYNDNDQAASFSSELSNVSKYENDCKIKTIHYTKDVVTIKEQRTEKEDNSTSLSSSSSSSRSTANQKYDPLTFSSINAHHTTPMTEPTHVSALSFPFPDKEMNDGADCGLDCKSATNKEIWKKISQLKLNFHKNDALGVQRSACFWDTCEFDTPPIYIPMSSTKGYGCFCHPECAVAFLMSEHIDTSVKFERYYLLNSIYGPIYNYNKSIKPAANPHYLLNKFYGSLTINEYRKMFQCEQVVYMVNKPLTNVLPELYEDNNDFFIGNKIIQNNNTIEIKKKGTKNVKSSILNEAFGIR